MQVVWAFTAPGHPHDFHHTTIPASSLASLLDAPLPPLLSADVGGCAGGGCSLCSACAADGADCRWAASDAPAASALAALPARSYGLWVSIRRTGFSGVEIARNMKKDSHMKKPTTPVMSPVDPAERAPPPGSGRSPLGQPLGRREASGCRLPAMCSRSLSSYTSSQPKASSFASHWTQASGAMWWIPRESFS